MSRVKLVLLSMLTMLVLGGIASASAHAEECGDTPTVWVVCTGTEGAASGLTELAAGTYDFSSEGLKEGAGFVSLLLVAALNTHIACEKVTDTGTFVQPSGLASNVTGTAEITFNECKVVEPTECEVELPIVAAASFTIGAEEAGEKLGVTFTGTKEGGVFATINLKGTGCTLSGKQNVTGKITCHLHEFLSDKAEHQLLCLHTDTGLLFAKKSATFELHDDIFGLEQLPSGPKNIPWAIDLQ